MSDTLKLIVKNITPEILFELFKIQIPMTICFVDENNQENLDYRIKIQERVFDKGENKPLVRIGASDSLYKDSYERILTSIDMKLREGYKYGVFADSADLILKKNLIDLLGTFNSSLIESCTYIDYNSKENYFELRNQPTGKGISDVIYYFEKDNSILQFDGDGPSLFMADSVNNITDILCD